MAQRTLFTVGHSTRQWKEFIDLLLAWEIEQVVDVRTIPRSRAFPWFAKERMEKALARVKIRYCHLPELGGLRHGMKDSVNAGWRNASFRGYADYMQSDEFEKGLKTLNNLRKRRRVCILCSEAVWWRIPVKHIMSETVAKSHELTEFAVVKKRRGRVPEVWYPDQAA